MKDILLKIGLVCGAIAAAFMAFAGVVGLLMLKTIITMVIIYGAWNWGLAGLLETIAVVRQQLNAELELEGILMTMGTVYAQEDPPDDPRAMSAAQRHAQREARP